MHPSCQDDKLVEAEAQESAGNIAGGAGKSVKEAMEEVETEITNVREGSASKATYKSGCPVLNTTKA